MSLGTNEIGDGETIIYHQRETASDGAIASQWASVQAKLQQAVGDVEYQRWLKQVSLIGLDGDELTLLLPTKFLRDWVSKEYGALIAAVWQAQNPNVQRIDIRAPQPVRGTAPKLSEPTIAATEWPEARADVAATLDQRFTFATFVVGEPNEFAYACARRVAESPSVPGFNPLFLYGSVGLGKTHLMQAIAWELSKHPRNGRPVSVAYMTAEKFMYRFINALRNQSTLEFKNELRSVDVLMIDDVQFLIGRDNTQKEFFHTFNALIDAGKRIVISANKSPADLSGIEDRVRARIGCGMVADLQATTYQLRISILEARAHRAGVDVPAEVMEFLARKITSNVRDLEAALNRLIAHANLFKRPVTLETAHEVLHDMLKAFDRRVTIQEIQKRVAQHWSIRVTEMSSARRSRNIARPRQVAMYLSKQLTEKSLPDIGRHFGDRDHTTVMHAVARVSALMATDAAFAGDVEMLRRLLEA